ncbi:MAG: thioesterase family protein [Planctomycetota bacterium]|nr:thioesterase family protein [Planctomycetota bacterium]
MAQATPSDDVFELPIRVRYSECDPMNVAHHSAYTIWMEMARTEMLRHRGVAYRELEARGVFFVVARLSVRYRRPARYDDALTIRVTLKPSAGVKVEHEYQILRGTELLAAAETTLACVDRDGRLQPVPPGTLGA